MGKVYRKKKHLLLVRTKQAREKIRKLKAKYRAADTRERQNILAKIQKISPGYPTSELQTPKK